MNYLNLSIVELHQALLNGQVTPLELTKLALERARKDNNNVFEYICEKEALVQASNLDTSKKDNLLWGIPFVLKDNFSTKDIPTTGSSNILNGYVPVFSSEVYQRLVDQGAILIGKATLDELGMGGQGISGHLGRTYNPWDETHKHIIGGSSCGSAAAVAAGIVPFSLGSDTGDSARKPASFANLVGFKPTWGRISRFGLFPFASSLDHVGYFTRNVYDSAIVLSVLAGKDDKDMSSSNQLVPDYTKDINNDIKGMRVAIIDEIYDSFTDKEVKKAFEHVIDKLQEMGVVINHVHMDINLCRVIYPVYIALSSSEAISNTANLDGLKFGPRGSGEDYLAAMKDARTKGFSYSSKKRLLIGGYVQLEENQKEIYLKALKCRQLIVDKMNEILKDNDFVYLPSSPSVAPLFDGQKVDPLSDEYLIADNYLAIANFSGLPSLSLPLGFKDGLPFGGNIIGRLFEEAKVLNIANKIEDIVGLANLMPESVK